MTLDSRLNAIRDAVGAIGVVGGLCTMRDVAARDVALERIEELRVELGAQEKHRAWMRATEAEVARDGDFSPV